MSGPPLALQWSLHQTADSALSVTRGIVRAATSDNIQASAVLACERFGATLAMWPETCDEIERLIIGVPKPVRAFFGAYIGYSAGDSAAQLVQNKAGVQFLALAAALVTTTGSFQSSLALQVMLEASESDKTLLPTLRQLKDLLAVLEHRLVASRFAELVVSCLEVLPVSTTYRKGRNCKELYPDADGIAKLVDAFRQLNRIGDATSLRLKASSCAPWVIAFTKWCLGVFPTIQLLDGSVILSQPTSCVTIIADVDHESGLDIAIHRDLRSPVDLITAGMARNPWTGMVRLEQYWQWLWRRYSCGQDLAAGCLAEALPYALHQTLALLRTAHFGQFNPEPIMLPDEPDELAEGPSMIECDEEFLPLVPHPFPADTIVADMLCKLRGSSSRVKLRPLPPGTLLADLPAVAIYVTGLKKSCICDSKCGELRQETFYECDVESFFDRLTRIVCDIVCLSLFELPDNLLVHLNHQFGGYPFMRAIRGIIDTGKPGICTINDILDWTLSLVGHERAAERVRGGNKQLSWVLSSEKGQVVYPRLFETCEITRRGFLTLSWAPGLLRYQDETYTTGLGPQTYSNERDYVTREDQALQVDKPRNILPDYKLAWLVAQQDGYLEISATLRHELNQRTFGTYPPLMILQNIARSLVLGPCRHDPSTPLDEPDAFARYTGPLLPQKDTGDDMGRSIIRCVAVEGNDGLALLTMSAFKESSRLVVRGRACLGCALEVCRKSNAEVLIL